MLCIELVLIVVNLVISILSSELFYTPGLCTCISTGELGPGVLLLLGPMAIEFFCHL